MTGWWYTYPSEKYDFVNWDHEIPNIWKNKNHVPNHQPDDIWIWNMVNQIDALNGGVGKYRPPNSVKKSRAHLVDLILFRILLIALQEDIAQVWTNNVGGSSRNWFLRWVIYPKRDRVLYHGRKLMFTKRGRGLHQPPATGWFQMAR